MNRKRGINMSVDYYTCHNCEETFCDCGEYVSCECGNVWC